MKDKTLPTSIAGFGPVDLGGAKPLTEKAPGGMLHSRGGDEDTIILCQSCKKPLWIVHPVRVLGPFSVEQREATPVGHKVSLSKLTKGKNPSFTCPLCGGEFAKYNDKLQTAQYMTSKGII